MGGSVGGLLRHKLAPSPDKRQWILACMARAITHRESYAKRSSTCHPIRHANMQASRTQIGRQLLAASKGRVAREPYRCFSCSVRQAQQQTPPPPPPKAPQDAQGTTHFGFETVAEALKEQRGRLPYLKSEVNLYLMSHSWRRLLLRCLILRLDERLHVPRHPPPLERPLRPEPKPGP
jgi:hypothetical protein